MTIGDRIRQIRKKVTDGQKSFAEIFGVSVASVSSWENDQYRPPPETLAKIAELGGESLDWLITGKEKTSGRTPPTDKEKLRAILSTDLKLLDEVRRELLHGNTSENETPYGQGEHQHLSDDEKTLLEYFRLADSHVRRTAILMLKASVEESRRNEGGGSNSAGMKSA
jgi:transcriptional regulator with XRE-family HTH domain